MTFKSTSPFSPSTSTYRNSFCLKSFPRMRNRGELAAGWYEPSTLHKAQSAPTIDTSARASPAKQRGSPIYNSNPDEAKDEGQSDDDDLVGPTILGHEKPNRRAGPAVPNMQDLELQREMEADEQGEARQDLRYARKLDRKQQKERLEEIAPRAEAGTRERQLEKRREVNDKMRAFRDKSPGAVEEVRESDLLGDDGVDGFRAKKKEMERKKNERELRKEEVLRARAEEREERLQIHRAKEEKTVSMLKALAKQRYG
ncbi:MAG: hypothetical protein M1833_002451 [Piccolia ochrophora]|nr:MAG: hypothetical protein M1833_002451 [Piccolia ochrophora]